MAFSEYTGEVLPYSFEDKAIDKILDLEGGFNPKDPVTGLPVKYGIDQKANPDIDVTNLTKDQAAEIYRNKYWKASGADKLPEDLALVHFDATVNQGAMAKKFLEQSGGDVNKYLELRKQHYDELARTNPSKYGSSHKGWMNRLDNIAATAYDLQNANNFQEYSGEIVPMEKTKADIEKSREGGLKDIGKTIAAPIISGLASIPEATETMFRGATRNRLGPTGIILNKLLGAPVVPENVYPEAKIEALKDLSTKGEEAAESISESRSEETKKIIGESKIGGDLFDPSSWSIGEKPSTAGIAYQALEAISSTVPIIATALITKSPTIATGIGGTMGAGDAVKTTREYISKMSDEELAEKSPEFVRLSSQVGPEKARQIITTKASEDASVAAGLIASIGGNITANLITGKFDDLLLKSVKNRASRIALGTAGGMTEEGLQELAEGIATDLGIDQYVARKIGTDSFANLILGALGGAGPGGIRGAVAKEGKPEAAPEVREEPTFREVADEEIIPLTEEEKAQAEFAGAPEVEISGVGQAPGTQDIEASLAELEGTPVSKAPAAETVVEAPVAEQEVVEPKAKEVVVEEAPVVETGKAVNVKDFSPEDQKTIRSMEIDRNKIKKEKKLFPAFLRKHGVQPSEKPDLGLEGVSAPNIWKVAAPTFDELTSRAISEGFLMPTGDDVQDVENFRQYVKDYIGSGIISTGPDLAREGQIRAIDDSIQEIVRKYEKPGFGLEETTPAQLKAEADRKRAEEDAEIEREMAEKARQSKEEIKRRSEAAASEFELGRTAEEDLTGQKRFDEDDDIPFFNIERKKAAPELNLREDNPGGSWLAGKRADALSRGVNNFGNPKTFGTVTGYYRGEGLEPRYVMMPVDVLAKIEGVNAEQKNVRKDDLEAIKKIMSETNRLPQHKGEDYVPFITVFQDGTPYISEGNHRIMAAKELGFKYIPVELRYYNGAEQESGITSPENVKKYDAEAYKKGYSQDEYSPKAEATTPTKDATKTEAFKKWFGDSKVVDENGNPLVMYHGTKEDIDTFKPNSRGLIFVTSSKGTADFFSSTKDKVGGQNILPVYVKSENPFDYENEEHVADLVNNMPTGEWGQPLLKPAYIKRGSWEDLELPAVIKTIKDLGYDGMYVNEGKDKNLAVFKPAQIKSAIGNRGTFSADEDNITLNIGQNRRLINKTNEDIRDEKIRELQGLAQRKAATERRFAKDKSKKGDMFNFKVLSKQIDLLVQEIDDLKEDDRRPEAWLKRAGDAIADKKNPISKDVYDVIQAIYKKNPKLLDGLKLSVTKLPENKQAAGEFNPYKRTVYLYKDTSGVEDPTTIRHELTHSLEQMMPKEAKKALAEKWGKEFKSAYLSEKTEEGKKFFQNVMDMLESPSTESFNKAVESIPTLPDGSKDYRYYQFVTPSEYWAVNAEPLMQAYLGNGWQKFKNGVKALFEALKNLFGIKNNRIVYSTFNQIINGPRIGSTMLNDYVATSIPALNIHRNYLGGQPPLTTWAEPDSSIITDITYTLADKNIDLKNVQKNIIKEIGQIEDRFDAYMKEELYHGRSAKRIEDFLKQELLPIIKDLNKYGISIQQFDEFLHNRHAEERNKQINKVNPDLTLKDQGSGIKTEDARAYLDNLDAKDFAVMDKLASKIDSMVQGTQKILVTNGLEEQSTIDAWNGAYKHYVPLNRLDLDFSHDVTGMGQGISTRGGTTKRATGSLKEVADIFSNIAMQRERAIIRSEKARVGRAVYGLALKNPNTDFWLPVNPDAIKDPEGLARELESLGLTAADAQNFIKEPVTSDIDKDTGLVVNRININNRFSDNVLPIRVNGKDRFIFFNANNPEALRLVKSLKNMDAEQLGLVLGLVGKVTRWIAAVNTQYNPVFGAWNFTRDVGSAMLNLSTTPIADQKAKVLGNVFPAYWGIYSDLRSERKKQTPAEGKWADLWERYQLAGGQTGFRDQFAQSRQNKYQLEDSTKKTAKLVGDRAAKWIASHRKDANIIEREMSALNRGNVSKLAHAVFDLLSDYNDAMENAVRLSAFKAALDKKGVTEERAASIAKNLTVNFNRKGQASATMGALYAFFNAAVQGTMRIGETLAGPAGRKIIAGGLILGVGQALMLSMAGFDDDEPPEFLKDKNLIIPTGDGDYAIIPMPLGFSAIPGFGRRITEMVMNGDKIPSRVLGIFGMMADAFNPLGTGSFAQMLSPTAADPFVSVSMNKDSFGRPIYKEDRSTSPTPGYSRSREGASTLSKYLAEFINYSSGGTAYQKGYFSPTADEIDYLVGQLTGGAGREVQKASETAKGLISGEEVPAHRKPITGKIFGNINSPQAISAKFYRNVTDMANLENEIKGRGENQEDVESFMQERPESLLFEMANDIENQISDMNADIKQLRKLYPDDKQTIKDIEESKTQIMKDFNDRVAEAKKERQ